MDDPCPFNTSQANGDPRSHRLCFSEYLIDVFSTSSEEAIIRTGFDENGRGPWRTRQNPHGTQDTFENPYMSSRNIASCGPNVEVQMELHMIYDEASAWIFIRRSPGATDSTDGARPVWTRPYNPTGGGWVTNRK